MNLTPEPYTLEVAEVDWVAKALSTDAQRPVLTVAALAYYNGSAVLVATDTHRLHVLRLGSVEKEFPTKLIDLKRVLFEARHAKATHVRIAVDFSSVEVGRIREGKKAEAHFGPVSAPVFDTVTGTYPNFGRVIPETKRPVAEFFAINSKYLADATLLTRKNAFRGQLRNRERRDGHVQPRRSWREGNPEGLRHRQRRRVRRGGRGRTRPRCADRDRSGVRSGRVT